MPQSPDTQKSPYLLAHMQEAETEDDQQQSQGQDDTGRQPPHKLFVYRTDTGGWLATPIKVEGDGDTPLEDEEPEASLVERNAPTPETDERPIPTTRRREPVYWLHVLLILLVFILLESEQGIVTALFMPTAVIAITPNVRSISLQSSLQLGKLLEPITVSESQTVAATGHGHQNAARATGSVTFYNGLFTQQFVAQGTVFTGSSGVSIVTTQPASIPAGNPATGYGTVTVTAQAQNVGANGNISAGDVETTINNGLLVKSNPFRGGQDERDFPVVTKADTDTPAAALKVKVTASMSAALQQQLTATEQLQHVPCTPTVTADYRIGEEAQSVTVTVAETCTAIAYDTQVLQAKAMQLLSTQEAQTVGKGYMAYGNIRVTVTKATATQNTVVLSFSASGTWVYHLNEAAIQALVSGKSRHLALQLLTHLPGIRKVSISGITDNQVLPTDTDHIHVLVFLLVS